MADQVDLLHFSLSSAKLQELNIVKRLLPAGESSMLTAAQQNETYSFMSRSTSTTFKTEMMVTHTVQVEVIDVGVKGKASMDTSF